MALPFPQGFFVATAEPIEQNLVQATVATALTNIPTGIRFVGRWAYIIDEQQIYVFKNGILDTDFVPLIDSSSSLTDGNKQDILVSGNGTIWVIVDGAVVESKLASNAVTNPKIADKAVTLSKLADGAPNQAILTDTLGVPKYEDTVDIEDPTYSNFFLKSNNLGGWPRRLLFSLTADAQMPTGQAQAVSVLNNTPNFRSHTGAKANSTTVYFFPAGSLQVGMVIDVLAVIAIPASATTQDATVRLTDGTTVVTLTNLLAGNSWILKSKLIVKDLTNGSAILGIINPNNTYSEVTGLTLDNGIGLDLFVYSYASDPAIVKAFNIEVS